MSRTSFHHRHLPDPVRTRTLDTDALRGAFLCETLFQAGGVHLIGADAERLIVGGALPGPEPLPLHAPDALRAAAFCERRELGVMNVGAGEASVVVDGTSFTLRPRDGLYVGRGARAVTFASADPGNPGALFLTSFPAHASHPTTLVRREDARVLRLGSVETANRRTLHQYIHPEATRSCQLVMGYTELETGSVWNTMPPHTHARRCEVYLYFDLPDDARVVHLMGEPDATRHLFVANGQAVIAPSWSMHAGVGTAAYRFVWAMGGENQSFDDMDAVPLAALR